MSGADPDLAALRQVLDAALGLAPITGLRRISGGQSNPTFFLDHGDRPLVLRKQPGGPILRGAHAIDREYRVMQALSVTDVPVPRMVLFHDDPAALATPFYLMERLEGRVFEDAALPGIAPDERRAIYDAMMRTMARLHAVDPTAIGLGDFGKPGNYFARQVSRWSGQLAQSTGPRVPELVDLGAWLTANLPQDDGRAVIAHGDYRLGNLMFHKTEPRVIAVLDWELATTGHPMADLGYCAMAWVTSPDEYGGLLGLDTRAMGIPSMDEAVAAYFDEAGRPGDLTVFHRAFALFRFGVIFVGIADRVRAGNAAGTNATQLGNLPGALGRRGLEIIAQA